MVKVDFIVERETEKAVYVCTKLGYAPNTTKYRWLPKSAVKIETYVSTVNPCTGEPETYGKRVTEVACWLAREIRRGW